ncbi:alkane 1-monooxygenase [Tateyamaria sp. SN6-1]|uniref:alkane 1-monooxygenase n=1 Tax=Tateyamaria sp. SN6-1 TaxID=3092148 RepID=UPI0039F60C19
MPRLLPFAIATLTPALLLAAASLWGGTWAVAAVLAITVVVFFLDKITVEMPAGDTDGHRLSEVLGIVHFVLLGLAVWAMGSALPMLDKVLIVVGCGLYFGQISNSNAHELIHRRARWAFRLGAANYASVLFGHHTSAHRLVHHVYAATARDPATARLGEGFWAYLPRTWIGSFRAGLRAERQRRDGAFWPTPYRWYVAGAALSLCAAALLAGGAGIAGLIAIALYAQIQLMLSDYVQHYGLIRAIGPDGRPEPMGPQHSWNTPHWYSSAMMLNAPRHSEHHLHPGKPFPALTLDADTMPMLPRPLPVMAVVALIPPLWGKVMDRRVAAWAARAQQEPSDTALAAE